MPKASRVCNKLGCPETVDSPDTYCPDHKKPAWAGSKRNQQNPPGWQRIRQHIFHRDNNTCVYCGNPATEIDHVIPVSQGGSHRPSNLVAACTKCNQEKNLRERRQPKDNPNQ